MKSFKETNWLNFSEGIVPYLYLIMLIIAFPYLAVADDATQMGTGNPLLALETTGSIPIGKKELSEAIPQGLVENGTTTQDPQGEKPQKDQANDDSNGPGIIAIGNSELNIQPVADEVIKDVVEKVENPAPMIKDEVPKEPNPTMLSEKSEAGTTPTEESKGTPEGAGASEQPGELKAQGETTGNMVTP